MFMQHIEHYPPAFTASVAVASLGYKSMNWPAPRLVAQQQQKIMIPMQMRGDRQRRMQMMIRGRLLMPTMKTQMERMTVSMVAICCPARTMMAQTMDENETRTQRFSQFLTHTYRFRRIALIVFLAIFKCSFLPSSLRSQGLIQSSAIQMVLLTQLQISDTSFMGYLSTACLDCYANIRKDITLPKIARRMPTYKMSPIAAATAFMMKLMIRSSYSTSQMIIFMGMRAMNTAKKRAKRKIEQDADLRS